GDCSSSKEFPWFPKQSVLAALTKWAVDDRRLRISSKETTGSKSWDIEVVGSRKEAATLLGPAR
ncbi:hypothetical protein N8716_00565, partial [Pontimonas sp.]|nr:hypothetical protein [Pontimonas sp.]